MRAFLSKILLIAFIFLFATPTSLFAQNNWVAPAGGPIGNNTPSPVNVGTQFQEKPGPLSVYGVTSKGYTLFDTNPAPSGPSLFISLVRSFFANDVDFGVQGTAGTNLNLFGNFRYLPTNPEDGTPANGQPQPGYVLTALDTNGNTGWAPATGGADPCVPVLPTDCQTGTTLPPGSQGQTLWYSAPNVLQATDQIKHDTMPGTGWTRTTLNNQVTDIKGTQIVYIGNIASGTTQIGSPATKIVGSGAVNIGNGASGVTTLDSPQVRFGTDGSSGQYQTVTLKSGGVNFGENDDDGYYQTTTFNSDAVKFKNVNMDPGTGYLPYSLDDEGRFKWNKNLTYELNQGGTLPYPQGTLTLENPDNGGLGIFRNRGFSWLEGDVFVGNDGDLYLDGIGAAQPSQMGLGLIKHLCYITTTKKVVTCDDNPIIDNGGTVGSDPGSQTGSVTYTANSGVVEHVFNTTFNDTAVVKYCAGGGGGGGGGLGAPAAGSNDLGTGGNGGGGGGAGECNQITFSFTPGDTLRFNIGTGGNGGNGADYDQDNNIGPTAALAGNYGQATSVTFDPISGADQNFPLVNGGLGGGPGRSVWQPGGLNIPASHGNSTLSMGANSSYFNGWPGYTNTGASNFPGNPAFPNNASRSGDGGRGGAGEAYDANGQLRTQTNNPAWPASLSAGGGPGTTHTNPQNVTYNGGNGYSGNLREGGGGGAGSAGKIVAFPSANPNQLHGGDGGNGGGGYVMISW
jgi:hypothetical protein